MARYRKIDTRIWNDERFALLTDDAKLVFLFLLTHPHLTSLGAMRATVPGLAAELGWNIERFRKAFDGLLADTQHDDQPLVEHDDRACFIGLPKFLKYNSPENPNVVKSWGPLLDLLPECSHKGRLLSRVREHVKKLGGVFVAGWERVCPTLSKGFAQPFRNGMPNPEPEPEQEPKPELDSISSPDGEKNGTARASLDEQPLKPTADKPFEASIVAPAETARPKKSSTKFSADDMQLAREMFAGNQELYPDATPPNFDRWANTFRLLRETGRDRTPAQIRVTLAWVRQDQFWKSNILSPDKLRHHWDVLQVKIREANNAQRSKPTTARTTDGTYRAAPDRRASF